MKILLTENCLSVSAKNVVCITSQTETKMNGFWTETLKFLKDVQYVEDIKNDERRTDMIIPLQPEDVEVLAEIEKDEEMNGEEKDFYKSLVFDILSALARGEQK